MFCCGFPFGTALIGPFRSAATSSLASFYVRLCEKGRLSSLFFFFGLARELGDVWMTNGSGDARMTAVETDV